MNSPKITGESTPEERYDSLVAHYMAENGWPKRKARRYVDQLAAKMAKKLIEEGRKRQEKLRAEGKLIDTSDLREEIEEEFKELPEVQPITRDF